MTEYLSYHKAGPLYKLPHYQSNVYCFRQVENSFALDYNFFICSIRCIRDPYLGQQFLLIQHTKIGVHGKRLATYLFALHRAFKEE